MKKLAVFMLCCLCLLPLCGVSHAQTVVKLGVLAKRGAAVAQKKWGTLADYLTSATGSKFILIPLSFKAVEPAVKGKKVDYLLANPGFYVDLKARYGIKALATMLNRRQDKALDQFGGVLIVKADSPIDTVADLTGKRFMCVKKTSFGGGQMAFRLMIENGVNPFRDVTLLEGRKHDPEWPLAAIHPSSSDGLDQKVADALFGLKADHPAAMAAKIVGWKPPLNYVPVADCLKIVREKTGI